MRHKIIEIANECGLTGMKRVGFYILAPFVVVAGCVKGFVIGVAEGLRKSD